MGTHTARKGGEGWGGKGGVGVVGFVGEGTRKQVMSTERKLSSDSMSGGVSCSPREQDRFVNQKKNKKSNEIQKAQQNKHTHTHTHTHMLALTNTHIHKLVISLSLFLSLRHLE